MKKLVFSLLTVMLTATSAAFAAPSVNGSSGLIDTPSADVLREGQTSLGYYHLKSGGVGVVDIGLSNNLEIGVAGFRYDGGNHKTMVNAKLSLAPETVLTPGLAFGIEDAANTGQRSVYAVASKGLPFGLRIHVGAGSGRYDGVFAGLEKTINPAGRVTGNNVFPATTLIAEYDGRNMNYGARLSIVPGLKVDAGWRNHGTYFGITFTR